MRRFVKKPEATFVVIPGVGRINEGRVLEGEDFAKFVPSLLVELLEEPAPAPAPARVLVEVPLLPPAPTAVFVPKPSAPILLDGGPVKTEPPMVETKAPVAAKPVQPTQSGKKTSSSKR